MFCQYLLCLLALMMSFISFFEIVAVGSYLAGVLRVSFLFFLEEVGIIIGPVVQEVMSFVLSKAALHFSSRQVYCYMGHPC